MTISHDMHLDLPPGFTAVPLRELGDAFEYAQRIAAEAGAGTLVHVRRFDLVEFAIVLEPEEPLAAARRALYAAMNAMAEALAAHAPPEKPVAFEWPDTILLDGGIIGGAQMATPEGCPSDVVPDWLVIGMKLRTIVPILKPAAPGGHILDTPLIRGTSLDTEGFEMIDTGDLIASFARHLMVAFDIWREKGFVPVGEQYLALIPAERGVKRGIDGNGDLLIRRFAKPGDVERVVLAEKLATPGWLDPETGDPWL